MVSYLISVWRICGLRSDTYLQTQADMLQAIELLLRCELFEYHDARMVNIMMADAQEVSSWSKEPRLTRRIPTLTSCISYIT